ncbi:MAG: helix-turn-helix transcriptional regulator [Clostridia bacterium]|nr:helix-turn-helix transcriptional regulator [Clostridia bacterium]
MNLSELRIESIEDIFFQPHQEPENVQIHKKNRPSWGVSVLISGKMRHTQDSTVHLTEPGMVQIVPRGGNYFIECELESSYYLVNFLAEGLDDRVHSIRVADPQPYIALMRRMYEYPDQTHMLHQTAMLYEFFALLADEMFREARETTKYDISPSVRYMREHLADASLDTERIAAASNISAVYFRKLFRAQYGVPPIRWLAEQRIRRARRLLAERQLSVAQIAQKCGYSDIFSFSNAFKKAVGMSPTAYAKDLL